MAWPRGRDVKIRSTTGYVRSIMTRLLPFATAQGFAPLNLICGDDLSGTKLGPLGMHQCFVDLAVYSPHSFVKVDDTAPGVAEGEATAAITVGVATSGNFVGNTVESLAALP